MGLLAFILGLVYWRTLLPVVGYWGDMAKFQFVGKVLGTPHPSGYPLYVVLNHLFVDWFPKGSLALRANLLSACFSIVAVCFLYLSLLQLQARPLAAFSAALAFGLTYSLWSFSLVAEVYTLNILFTAAVVYFMLRWRMERKDRDFYLAWALYALSFGNHLLMIALLPAMVYLVWLTDRSVFRQPKRIGVVAAFFLLSSLQYSYILWRTQDPTTAFLETDTRRFLRFISGPTSNSTFAFSITELLAQRLPLVLGYLYREYRVFLLLSLWGMTQVKDRGVNLFLLLVLLGNFLFAIQFEVREPWVYFLPTYLILAIYLGLGIEGIAQALDRRPFFRPLPHRLVWLAVPLVLLVVNYPAVDQSQHTLHAEIVNKILTVMDRDALILVDEYDYESYFWYYLLGEDYQRRRLYVWTLDGLGADGAWDYLHGDRQVYIPHLRQTLPADLSVYALWRVADELKQAGLQVEETDSRYVYRVTLPGP
jgi:hypothetical protein